MNELSLKTTILVAQTSELSESERDLVHMAIEATKRSYTPYSHFHVGAAVRLANGVTLMGCNQENAAFPSGICAERSALFAAGAQYPEEAVEMIAIAASNDAGELTEEPVSPCGTCRQVLVETETRYGRAIRILLYGRRHVYIVDGIKQLMPLTFTEF